LKLNYGPKLRRQNLSAPTLRIIGILILVAAAVVAILNLKRVANLGMMWLVPVLMIIGIGLVVRSRGRK
jgi:tryptophan-rich sensory protein